MKAYRRLMRMGAVAFLTGMVGFYLAEVGFSKLGHVMGFVSVLVILYVVIKGQVEFSKLRKGKDD